MALKSVKLHKDKTSPENGSSLAAKLNRNHGGILEEGGQALEGRVGGRQLLPGPNEDELLSGPREGDVDAAVLAQQPAPPLPSPVGQTRRWGSLGEELTRSPSSAGVQAKERMRASLSRPWYWSTVRTSTLQRPSAYS